MKGEERVLDYLNRSLRNELTAINQYWLHFRVLDNWGYKDLAKKWREESIEEMRHADRFTSRILFLEGLPNLQLLDPLRIGQTVEEIQAADLALELDGRALYLEAAKCCISIHGRVSKELYDDLLMDEEKHIDFLEIQQELVRQLGVQLYSQKHIGHLESSKQADADGRTFRKLLEQPRAAGSWPRTAPHSPFKLLNEKGLIVHRRLTSERR